MTPSSIPLDSAAAPPAAQTAGERDASPASWYALAVLVLIGLYAFIDRQIFVLQAEPIRQQLALSDFQLGLLQGLGVGLFAAVVGYPIGWLADRYDRRVVLAGCIVVWSLAVAACGLARGFGELFIASAMVGAGEAGFTPIAYALIPELFRNRKRMVANSIFIVGGRAGVGLAIALCGYIIQGVEQARPWLPAVLQGLEGWRLAFFAAALPAPVFVLALLSVRLRRPVAATAPLANAPVPTPPASLLLDFVRPQRTMFFAFYLGMGLSVTALAAVGTWLPVVAMRQFSATPVQVGSAMGLSTVLATALGMLLTVAGLRWATPRFGARTPVVMLFASFVATALTALSMLLAQSSDQLFVLFGVHATLMMTGMMVYPTVIQDFSPAPLRGRIIALLTVVMFAFGAISPPVVGKISDAIKHLPNGLLLASTGWVVATQVLGCLCLAVCIRLYPGTVQAARAFEARSPAASIG